MIRYCRRNRFRRVIYLSYPTIFGCHTTAQDD